MLLGVVSRFVASMIHFCLPRVSLTTTGFCLLFVCVCVCVLVARHQIFSSFLDTHCLARRGGTQNVKETGEQMNDEATKRGNTDNEKLPVMTK